MASSKYKLRRQIALLVLILLVTGLGFLVTMPFKQCSLMDRSVKLSKKRVIADFAKIEIQPISIKKNQPVEVDFNIESFQYPDLLKEDLRDITLLIDDQDNPYKPTEWKPRQETESSKSGILVFPPLAQWPSTLTFVIFLSDDECRVTWNVPVH